MKKIIFWILAFGLTGVIQLSSAVPYSNDANKLNVLCRTSDNKEGYCKKSDECPHNLRIIVEMNLENRIQFRSDEKKYIQSIGSRDCKKVNIPYCCDYRSVEGINQLLEQECGPAGGSKVAGGSEIVLMSRPWMALLKLNNKTLCGGSIIHKRFVLTAAHCVDKDDLKSLSVHLGEHQTNTTVDTRFVKGNSRTAPPVKVRGIEKVYIHEEYNSTERYNDIALVKLSEDVEFQVHIKPICLPLNKTLQKDLRDIMNFTITGWGATDGSNSTSHVPLEAKIPKQNPSECLLERELKSTELCAGGNGKNVCLGDSGGPLIEVRNYNDGHKYVQYGIASHGMNCSRGYPSVYTSVISFIPWIATKIGTN